MKLATIAPVSELDALCGEDEIHLVLYHLLPRYPEYQKFYKERAKGYIILDNGAYEGKSAQMRSLVDRATYIGASEIVIPDELLNAVETLRLTAAALGMLATYQEKNDFRYMLVPQGTTITDWEDCFDKQIQMYHSVFKGGNWPVIGLSKVHDLMPGGRRGLISLIPPEYEIHLLGYSRGEDLLSILAKWKHLRSMDTAKTIVSALAGRELSPGKMPKRPDNYFELELAAPQRTLALQNIRTLKEDLEVLTRA